MLNDIFKDLDFIAKIPKEAKPNFSDKTFTLSNEWFPTLKRRWKHEQGEKGVLFVNNLIADIEKIYKTCDIDSQKKIREKLTFSIPGLDNIVETYSNDNQTEVAKNYSLIIEKIKNMNEKYTKLKKQFFTYQPSIL